MDTRNGALVSQELLESFPVEERQHFIPVKRDLTKIEELEKQIQKYSLCGCGSGKKFKFCCYKPA